MVSSRGYYPRQEALIRVSELLQCGQLNMINYPQYQYNYQGFYESFPNGKFMVGFTTWSVAISETDWLEVPTKDKAYFLGLCSREDPRN